MVFQRIMKKLRRNKQDGSSRRRDDGCRPWPIRAASSSAIEERADVQSQSSDPDARTFTNYAEEDNGVEDVWNIDDDVENSTATSTPSVHPLVEQTVRQGEARRYSRHTFCLAGDFTLNLRDMEAIIDFLTDLPNAVNRIIFLQTTFSVPVMQLFCSFLVRPDSRIQRLILSSVVLEEAESALFFAALARNRSVAELVFHDYTVDVDATVGQALALVLPRCCQLTSLSIRGCDVTETGLFYLSTAATFKHIKTLCLKGCKLNSHHVELLLNGFLASRNYSLQSLDLSNNKLCFRSLKWLAGFLQEEVSGLQVLSLTGNTHLFDGAEQVTKNLADSLAQNTCLRAIELERCGLQERSASLLFQSLEKNTTLRAVNIRINSGIGVSGHSHMIQSISQFSGLRMLTFDALFPELDNSLLSALEKNTSLTKLVAHYGLDQAVQNKVKTILRRNQLYLIAQLPFLSPMNLTQRGLVAICLLRLAKEVNPRVKNDVVGTTAIFSIIRKYQPWNF
eukprot:CAMPEP_0198138448 /NCGR_PEP_ID=MMETSP1443-20131203/1861_1 /TAXON_ID=186043 /ORGANISM="Entomoneis sp., Strain CCMP2396" /LENGTH=507 /DNA_ID=CAMNT_0043800235 /DNA_START=176 /DNA_END=1699 /DNA_ORIENTATION=-